jgi:ABC-type sugar transport system substrate-binding protein
VLMNRGVPFTAVFAFNDVSAFGAIRAFQERGLAVPRDISVIGFDDVWGAAYHIPSLTTIRQPLRRMGSLGAETILQRIESWQGAKGATQTGHTLHVEPELVVRESTGPAPAKPVRPQFEAGLAPPLRAPGPPDEHSRVPCAERCPHRPLRNEARFRLTPLGM